MAQSLASLLCWQRVALRVPARFASPVVVVRLFGGVADLSSALCSQFSKIGKVMRHIHALSEDKVPRDEEFKFRERAKILVDKWHDVLKANGAPESTAPATNGTRKAADAEDVVSSPNVKPEENGTETKENGANMEVDAHPKSEPEQPVAEPTTETDSKPTEDAPNGAADESMLADITMSEAAA